jgi:hypothetical protein
MAGRRFWVRLAVRFVGGVLVPDDRAAIERAVVDSVGAAAVTVSAELFDVVEVAAEVRAATAVDAVAELDRSVDAALLRTGLFEQFDVSGKSLDVRPSP